MGSVPHHRSFPEPPPQRVTLRSRILFLSAAWLIILMPFIFWRGPWFGRPLSEQQIANYLHEADPVRVEHALGQIGERMGRGDALVASWYPDLLALSKSSNEEVRTTDAWAMGQDPRQTQFRDTLSHMLNDPALSVRAAAALSLVKFDNADGHDQIVALLEPVIVRAPIAGRVTDLAKANASLRRFTSVVKLYADDQVVNIAAPWECQFQAISVNRGQQVPAGAELGLLQPSADTVFEALRALYVIGRSEDLPAVDQYLRRTASIPDRVRQQAERTDQAIRDRSERKASGEAVK